MKIGPAHVEVAAGDITRLDAEAIVIPANTMLWTGGGVAALVRHKGGGGIENRAMAHAPMAVGTAVTVPGGDLRAGTVVHAVIAGQDLTADAGGLAAAVAAALHAAESSGCRSVAIPIMDGETHTIEMHIAARITVDAVIRHLLSRSRLQRIWLVEQEPMYDGVFAGALSEKFTNG